MTCSLPQATVADEKRMVEDQQRVLDAEIADFQLRKAQHEFQGKQGKKKWRAPVFCMDLLDILVFFLWNFITKLEILLPCSLSAKLAYINFHNFRPFILLMNGPITYQRKILFQRKFLIKKW